MIELIAIAAGAVAGAFAGQWVRARARRSAMPAAVSSEPDERLEAPFSVGDVLVLEGGHGRELWLARAMTLAEKACDPCLVLFESDGPLASRALVAVDPRRREELALLARHPLGDETTPVGRAPVTIEVPVEGAPMLLSLEARRAVHATSKLAVDGEEDGSDLPAEGAWNVTTYRGGAHGFAVSVRVGAATHLWVGRTLALSSVSILEGSRAVR